MIEYAGAPQIGEYVIINDRPESVRMVTTIVMNVDTAVKYSLDDMIISFEQDALTRVKPDWNIGELVRYKGRVYKVQNVTVGDYKFVYALDDKDDWVAEKDLEHVNDIKYSFNFETVIRVNKYCEVDRLRGVIGRVNKMSNSGVLCYLAYDCEMYTLPWEAIDVEEKKVEPYNAELICIKSGGVWKVGELAKVIDNHFCFRNNITDAMGYCERKVHNLNDVNNLFTTVRFAEVKEEQEESVSYYSGKFFVIKSSYESSLKSGKIYIVENGVVTFENGSQPSAKFRTFKDVKNWFSMLEIIEVVE